MKTIAFMCNSAQKRMRESERRAGMSLMEMGYANGYVAISPEHPLWRVDYDNCDIHVWRGLTFSDDACCIQEWDNVEMIDDVKQADIPQDWWVLGFDTMHYGDGAQHDREWMQQYQPHLRTTVARDETCGTWQRRNDSQKPLVFSQPVQTELFETTN